MKELEYLDVINNTLGDSSLLGDDCAFLQEFNMYVTQDTLVEKVHFDLDTTTAYELGQKAVSVNLSDLAASLSQPSYITISLSLPKNINTDFVRDFYTGVNEICKEYNVIVAGGDLTGSKEVVVSVCAIGKKIFDVNVSRHYSKPGQAIVVTGTHGDSAGGLRLLSNGCRENNSLIKKHLLPQPKIKESIELAAVLQKEQIKNLAIMDTSDGLGDAIYKLSKGCGYVFDINYKDIPVNNELKRFFPDEYKDLVMWGGEDFELLFTVEESIFDKLDKNKFFRIGSVSDKKFSDCDNEDFRVEFQEKSFKHFGE